jgi:hypothetical protein
MKGILIHDAQSTCVYMKRLYAMHTMKLKNETSSSVARQLEATVCRDVNAVAVKAAHVW